MTREIKLTQRSGDKIFVRNITDALCDDETVVAARWQDGEQVFSSYRDEEMCLELEKQAGAPALFRATFTKLHNFIKDGWGEEVAKNATHMA